MVIALAGLNIGLDPAYDFTREFVRDYETVSDTVDFSVACTESDIETEIALSPHRFPERGIFETTALFRRICRTALTWDAFFLHAAVIALDGAAFAFLAPSGTGKSTHVGLWMDHFTGQGKQPYVVNGAIPLLRFVEGELLACGHPWSGKENWHRDVMVPLRGICFLEQGKGNEIRPLTQGETIDRLFGQLLMPQDAAEADQLFALLERMIRRIPAYLMKCTISAEAVVMAHEAMSQGGTNS